MDIHTTQENTQQTIENAPVNTHDKPHVVIIGAGFGGLQAAKSLAHLPIKVTLIDRNNHHLFQPILYQVATADLLPAHPPI